MMRRVGSAYLMIFAMLLFALPTFAQDNQNATNFCAGRMTYIIPVGWVDGGKQYTSVAAQAKIATSDAALHKAAENLVSNEAVITIQVVSRASMIYTLSLDKDAAPSDILKAVVAQTAPNYTSSEISPITVRLRSAVEVELTNNLSYRHLVLVQMDENYSALLTLESVTSDVDTWTPSLFNVINSVTFGAPRFPAVENSLPLTQVYSKDDCSIAFAYPSDWSLTLHTPNNQQILSVQAASDSNLMQSFEVTLDSGKAFFSLTVAHDPQENGGNSDLEAYAAHITQQNGTELVNQTLMTFSGHPGIVMQVHIDWKQPKVRGEAVVIVILWGGDVSSTVTYFAAPDEADQWLATALAVAESLHIILPNS